MFQTSFIVSECGNSPEDAWGRAVAMAEMEDYTKRRPHGGILDKKSFKIIGKLQEGGDPLAAAKEIVDKHIESDPDSETALCIDAGRGEYYFVGRSYEE